MEADMEAYMEDYMETYMVNNTANIEVNEEAIDVEAIQRATEEAIQRATEEAIEEANQEANATSKKNTAKTYYESDDSYRYYSIIYTEDYTGAGFFPDQIDVETADAPGMKYPIGSGCKIFEAVQARDKRMVEHVIK